MARDLWGQELSTDDETAVAFREFLARRLEYDPTAVDALTAVVERDAGFALAHAFAVLLALAGQPGLDVDRHRAALDTAREPATDRERSFVGAASRMASGGPWAALDHWRRHADAHPGDLPALMQLTVLLAWSTDPAGEHEAHERLLRARDVVGDDPALLATIAMYAQDAGDLDTAWELGRRSLDLSPDSPVSAHPVAHVHFEAGDHDAGLAWLEPFVARLDPANVVVGHLEWHCALHLLDLGRTDDVLARYESLAARPAQRLLDGTSLLWRCRLAGLTPPGADPAGDDGATAVRSLDPEVLPFTFLAMHVLLAHAGAGDAGALRRLSREAEGWSAPGASLLLPGLARGLAAFVEDDPAAAVGELLALEPWFGRYGGSHAQREVLEDFLLRALVAAGRHDEASRRLRARLDRRPSGRDSVMLGLVEGPASRAGQRTR